MFCQGLGPKENPEELMQTNWYKGNCGQFPMARKMLVEHGTVSMLAKSVEANPPCTDIHQLAETESASGDRRKRFRAQVHWTISFLRPGTTDTVETVTQDLSSDGFYCLVNTVFVPGEIRTCTLSVPTYYPRAKNRVRPVHCRVRVIRVEVMGAGDLYGVGCRIEDYRFATSRNGNGMAAR
jgi:hypothetical protein